MIFFYTNVWEYRCSLSAKPSRDCVCLCSRRKLNRSITPCCGDRLLMSHRPALPYLNLSAFALKILLIAMFCFTVFDVVKSQYEINRCWRYIWWDVSSIVDLRPPATHRANCRAQPTVKSDEHRSTSLRLVSNKAWRIWPLHGADLKASC